MPKFKSILYLDDMRTPLILGIDVVRNYDEFVEYFKKNEVPELVSLDHDLDEEQYLPQETWGKDIDYSKFKEKTGLHCARWLIENNIKLKNWTSHSMNAVGKKNIEKELRAYCPEGEMTNLSIPYYIESAQ